MASTPFNIMFNERLNQFKFDSTRFQQAFNIFYAFNNVEQPVQTPPTFGSTKCRTHVEANIETVLYGPSGSFLSMSQVQDVLVHLGEGAKGHFPKQQRQHIVLDPLLKLRLPIFIQEQKCKFCKVLQNGCSHKVFLGN